MMLSDEQGRLAAQEPRGTGHASVLSVADVSPETLERARMVVQQSPDVRAERVLEACTRLLTTPLDSRDLADKMISRIVSDSLR